MAVCELCAPKDYMAAYQWIGNGCPPSDRLALCKAYIAKAVWDFATTRDLIEATRAVREAHGPEVHLVGGFSNVSFGMPRRKLINQVFTWLAVQAGADGGIVDPFQLNLDVLNRLDTESESFTLARDLLLGEDEFGMAFIQAHREGRLQN